MQFWPGNSHETEGNLTKHQRNQTKAQTKCEKCTDWYQKLRCPSQLRKLSSVLYIHWEKKECKNQKMMKRTPPTIITRPLYPYYRLFPHPSNKKDNKEKIKQEKAWCHSATLEKVEVFLVSNVWGWLAGPTDNHSQIKHWWSRKRRLMTRTQESTVDQMASNLSTETLLDELAKSGGLDRMLVHEIVQCCV